MRKIALAIAVAASVTVATVAHPTRAEAGCRGCWVGAGIAAGVVGAALIAGSARAYYGGYGYAPAYYGGYGYYGGYAYPYYGYAYPAPVYYAPRYYAPWRYVRYAPYYAPRRAVVRYYAPRRVYVRRHW
ncbi:MAG: hypothetical protein HXY30_04615 [Pseudorhodoplanes sp.]|nr:hypothetical protein [Pseudorhodoplanes sp.]